MGKPKTSVVGKGKTPKVPGKSATEKANVAAAAEKAKPAPAKAAYDPNEARRALEILVAKHGEPDAVEVEAFGELIDDAGRAKLGSQTKAVGVFGDGVKWAAQISAAFGASTAVLAKHYAAERFRYFLHCLRRLDAALIAEGAARGGAGAARTTTADREIAAREARAELLAKLTSYAGAREPERAALAEAIGTTEDFTALGTSIQGLVRLSRFWLGREDKKSRIVAKAAGLTEALVDRALTAAEALTGSAIDAALAPRRAGTDSPAVNIAEGSVLFEMMEAYACFERAHAKSPVVPRLAPGAATRHVVGPKKASKKSDAEAAPKDG